MSNQYPNLGLVFWISSLFFIVMLFYQQRLVKPGNMEKINLAFFTTNGIASLVYGTGFLVDALF